MLEGHGSVWVGEKTAQRDSLFLLTVEREEVRLSEVKKQPSMPRRQVLGLCQVVSSIK